MLDGSRFYTVSKRTLKNSKKRWNFVSELELVNIVNLIEQPTVKTVDSLSSLSIVIWRKLNWCTVSNYLFRSRLLAKQISP